MTHGSLFSGIGGFDLAAQWMGWQNIFQVEIDPFCQKVLAKNFPEVGRHGDIRSFTLDTFVNLCYIRLSNQNREIVDMTAKRKHYDEAVEMYNRGLSIQNIADFYDITRQAMWMILKRRCCEFRDNKKYGEENHFYRGTNADDKAQNLLEEAIERKIVVRKHQCEKCGSTGVFKDGRTAIQAHHCDYNKPLEVIWLCQKCHHEWHKTNKPIPRGKEGMPSEVSDSTTIDVLSGGFP